MSQIMSRHTPPGMCEDVKVIYLPQMGCLLAASNIHRPDLIPVDWNRQVSGVYRAALTASSRPRV